LSGAGIIFYFNIVMHRALCQIQPKQLFLH